MVQEFEWYGDAGILRRGGQAHFSRPQSDRVEHLEDFERVEVVLYRWTGDHWIEGVKPSDVGITGFDRWFSLHRGQWVGKYFSPEKVDLLRGALARVYFPDDSLIPVHHDEVIVD